ncbi:MAG: glycosyltransferase, partial [Magnetospirillum sp.]
MAQDPQHHPLLLQAFPRGLSRLEPLPHFRTAAAPLGAGDGGGSAVRPRRADAAGAGGQGAMTMAEAPLPAWVRVVIVNYNGGDLLGAVVDGLARQTMADFDAVIVDNGSGDGSVERLSLPDRRFRIIHAGGNLGFAAGCNRGAAGAASPWLAMLNPDAVPAPNWLERLRAATGRHPEAACFGSTQLMADDPSRLDGAGDNYSIFGIAWRGGYGAPATLVTGDIAVFSPCAAAALYRRDVFMAAGGF